MLPVNHWKILGNLRNAFFHQELLEAEEGALCILLLGERPVQ